MSEEARGRTTPGAANRRRGLPLIVAGPRAVALKVPPAGWITALATIFLISLVAASTANGRDREVLAATCGTPYKQWVWRQSSLAAYGIDGYLRYPANSIQEPDCNFLAHFLAVHNSNGTKWVQIGLTIGVSPSGYGVATNYKIYSDGVGHCGVYSFTNHGDPSGQNKAYYISYSGESGSDGCGPWAKYEIRKDDWYNQPIWYRYLDVSSPWWTAEHEVLKSGTIWPDNGDAWWGHQTATSWPLAYGIAWYDQPAGTWNEWTAAQGGTTGFASVPAGQTKLYSWCVDSVNRAHHARKGSC